MDALFAAGQTGSLDETGGSMRMKMGAAILSAVLAPGLALAGDVKTDFDKDYDFGKIKTFSTKIGTSWGNPLSEKRVTAEITEALTAKGWKAVPEGEADAMVVLHGAGEKQKSLNTFYSGGMGGWGYRGWGGGMGTATTTTTEYLVGTLVTDIFDAKSKALVFRGTATDEISDKPEKNQKKLEKITDKMFKDFPPGSAGK
jgi:hypothetical protein